MITKPYRLLAALEGTSSGDDLPTKPAKRQKQGTPTGHEIDHESEEITPSRGVKIRGALSEYDDDLSCPMYVTSACAMDVCADMLEDVWTSCELGSMPRFWDYG